MTEINIVNMGFDSLEIDIKPIINEELKTAHIKNKGLTVIRNDDDIIDDSIIIKQPIYKPKKEKKEKKENKTNDMKAYRKLYNEMNQDKVKKYREKAKEKAKDQKKEYYELNKEKVRERAKLYRDTHKEELKIKKEEKKAIYTATYRDKYNKIKKDNEQLMLLKRCIHKIFNQCNTTYDLLYGEKVDKNEDEVRFIKKDKSKIVKPIESKKEIILHSETETDSDNKIIVSNKNNIIEC
jgi:hypothetical protein